jgi:tetratricopeptide (TPR) repeat protein
VLLPVVRRTCATALVAALLSYAALTPLTPFARDTYATDARRHVILGGVILVYALSLGAMRRLPRRTALDVPILLVLVAMGVGVAASLDRRVSAEWVLTVLPVAPLFYLLADHRLFAAATLRRGIMVTGVVVAAFALTSVWRQWQDWLTLVRAVEGVLARRLLLPPDVPRVEGVGSHPNVLAAVLAVCAPCFITSIAGSSRWRRAGACAGLALVAAGLFFTLSRAAWVGAIVGAGVTAAGTAVAGHYRPRHPLRWLAVAALAAGLALALAASIGGARPDWLFRDSLDPRADMRRVGIEVFNEHRLTGAGPGMYVALYPEHRGAYPFAAVHSHNVPVQIAADYGLGGLAVAATMFGTVCVIVARRFLRGTAQQRRMAALAAGSLAAFGIHGLADAPHLFPEVLLLLAAVVAVLLNTRDEAVPAGDDAGGLAGISHPVAPASTLAAADAQTRHGHRPRPSPRLVDGVLRAATNAPPVLVLAVGLALAPIWWRTDRAAAAHAASVRAAPEHRWDDAVTAAQRAVTLDPRLAAYHLQLGAALAARYYDRQDLADRTAAILAYERGLHLQPRNGAALVDLATLQLDAGDVNGAMRSVAALRPLAGRDSLLQLAYATLVQRTSGADVAIETYAGLLALNPTLALTPFFQSDDFRATNYSAIVNRSLGRAEEIAGPGAATEGLRTAIRIFTGRDVPREDQLRAALAAMPDDVASQVALGRLLTAGGRLQEAEPLLRRAVARKGDSADAHAALGDWHAAVGNTPLARREWLKAAHLGDVRAMDSLGESFAPGAVPEAVIRRQRQLVESASITRFYVLFQTFRFTFLRHEPVPIIGPGDWLNALPNDFERWQANLDRWQSERRAATGHE